jgi:hypothetical protein
MPCIAAFVHLPLGGPGFCPSASTTFDVDQLAPRRSPATAVRPEALEPATTHDTDFTGCPILASSDDEFVPGSRRMPLC